MGKDYLKLKRETHEKVGNLIRSLNLIALDLHDNLRAVGAIDVTEFREASQALRAYQEKIDQEIEYIIENMPEQKRSGDGR